MSMGMTAPRPAPATEVPSWKLVATMTAAGALAGLLLVSAWQATLPRIEHHQGEVMQVAIREVLGEPARFDTLWLQQDKLVKALPAGTSPKGVERIYLGYDGAGKRVGFAVSATENGFQDPVTVMFGYDAAKRSVIAMRVISNKETPGLGDKIAKDSAFVNGFVDAAAPVVGVKPGRGTGAQNEVVMITGATISSRAVIRIIDNAVARWQPLMDAYREEATP
jgi:Na+-translocating ferredoxin:NAD+ oxidoreductase subunit G